MVCAWSICTLCALGLLQRKWLRRGAYFLWMHVCGEVGAFPPKKAIFSRATWSGHHQEDWEISDLLDESWMAICIALSSVTSPLPSAIKDEWRCFHTLRLDLVDPVILYVCQIYSGTPFKGHTDFWPSALMRRVSIVQLHRDAYRSTFEMKTPFWSEH